MRATVTTPDPPGNNGQCMMGSFEANMRATVTTPDPPGNDGGSRLQLEAYIYKAQSFSVGLCPGNMLVHRLTYIFDALMTATGGY